MGTVTKSFLKGFGGVIGIIIGAIVLFSACAAIVAGVSSPQETSSTGVPVESPGQSEQVSQPVVPVGPQASFSNGTHHVGDDVVAGTYRTDGQGDVFGCYFARLKNASGDFDAIKSNGIVDGPTTLTLQTGEYVEASGDCVWNKK